jgi:hypothetical protein
MNRAMALARTQWHIQLSANYMKLKDQTVKDYLAHGDTFPREKQLPLMIIDSSLSTTAKAGSFIRSLELDADLLAPIWQIEV